MSKKVTKEYPILELKCLKCDEVKPIPQKVKFRTNICLDCQRAQQRQYQREEAEREGRRAGIMGRFPYPLGKYEYYQQKFYERRKIMNSINDREEWIEQIKRNLKETVEDKELMIWINSHKDDEVQKKQKKIDTEFPDTRNMSWEEYMEGVGDDDVDS